MAEAGRWHQARQACCKGADAPALSRRTRRYRRGIPISDTVAFSPADQEFVRRIDDATQAHIDWSRRLLRCAVLKVSPGEDVLAADAHCRCQLGRWFGQSRHDFDAVDAEAARRLEDHHKRMHDAARHLCTGLLAELPAEAADLDAFERHQTAVIDALAHLKTGYLAHAARLDALTGLPLRYGLEEEFQRCVARARRQRERVYLLLLDVDHFKAVNDEHGHAVGDLALRHVADTLSASRRGGECLFRLGGEEFLLILLATDDTAAGRGAERMLQALRDRPLALAGGPLLPLRLSAGIAALGNKEALAGALTRADHAMYAAKRGGRDRWEWSVDHS